MTCLPTEVRPRALGPSKHCSSPRHRTALNSVNEGFNRAPMTRRAIGSADIARRFIRCHLTQDPRDQIASDDVVGNTYLPCEGREEDAASSYGYTGTVRANSEDEGSAVPRPHGVEQQHVPRVQHHVPHPRVHPHPLPVHRQHHRVVPRPEPNVADALALCPRPAITRTPIMLQ